MQNRATGRRTKKVCSCFSICREGEGWNNDTFNSLYKLLITYQPYKWLPQIKLLVDTR